MIFVLFKLRARSAVDVGISDRQLEMGASSREVRASMLMRSPLIDSAAPLLARGQPEYLGALRCQYRRYSHVAV